MSVVEFQLKPSRFYLMVMVLVFLASAVMLSLLAIAPLYKFLLLLVLVSYGVQLVWRFALLRDKHSVIALKKVDQDEWQVTNRAGVMLTKLRGDSTVTQWVAILRFDIKGQRKPLVSIIWRDSLPADQFRQLIVSI